ncbi:21 kDa protein-like [Rhodamnia argentea]|uniref:pectinesterase n=1 Tax=Rhodamnia argentea TaxID=178133 RepID=A0A8B8P2X9_9MYRT|nr:21 kDa protein-like [Rhodamnia argentea]
MHAQPSLRLLLLTLFLSHLQRVPAAGSPTPAPTPADGLNFIRSSCNVTLYPDVCYATLARYAASVHRDPARLTRAAIAVSLAGAQHAAKYVSNLSREADHGADQRAAAALHDCFENFGVAADKMRDSLTQMHHLGAAGSGEQSFRFQMSNVQTWMSAALTHEETCTDGFEDVADGPVKSGVSSRARTVKKVTSNALALVNSYVNKQAGP